MAFTKEILIEDYRQMIQAEAGHLVRALENGERHNAHEFVDSIISNRQALEDLGAQHQGEVTKGAAHPEL